MATINSNLVAKGTRHRGIYSGQDYDVAGRIFLAADTVLTAGDDLLFIPVGENQIIHKVTLTVVGDAAAGAGSIGRFQMLDRAGNPVVVDRLGPSSYAGDDSKFTSPETDAALYAAAAPLDGYAEYIIALPEKLAGPVYVGIRVTTGATVVEDTELFLAAYFKGETSMRDVVGPGYGDNEYLLDIPTP